MMQAGRLNLSAILDGLAVGIEHVGSTSVKNLWAKPIIDIDVIIPDYGCFPAVVERLAAIGYRHEGDLGIEGREAFTYEDKPDYTAHHLYVCPQTSQELRRHLLFRDYLRSHADAVEAYSRVKREGAALYPEDIDAYIDHKGALIEEIYRRCGV